MQKSELALHTNKYKQKLMMKAKGTVCRTGVSDVISIS